MVKLAILGAAGRMGKALISCAERVDGVEVVAAIEVEGNQALGMDAGLTAGVTELGVEIDRPSSINFPELAISNILLEIAQAQSGITA